MAKSQKRQEQEHALLLDWFARVERVMRGETPEDEARGGWPFWTYHAVQVYKLGWQAPCAAGGDEDADFNRWDEPLPNTVRFPRSRELVDGAALVRDPADLCGDEGESIGNDRCISLSALETVTVDDDVGGEDADDDDAPDTLAALVGDDIILPDHDAAPEPEFSPDQVAFATRIMTAWEIGRARTRFRAFNQILHDIAKSGDMRLWVKTRLFLGRRQRGFNAWRNALKLRGRKPRGGRLWE